MGRGSSARRLTAAASAVFLLAGCTHVRPADPGAPGTDLGDINTKLAHRVVRVRLADGSELLAHDVTVSRDSLYMREQMLSEADWWLGPRRAVAVSRVRSLEVTRRGRGDLDGALLGLGAGTAAGAAIGAAFFPRGPILFTTTAEVAIIGSIIFGLLGTGVGLLAGSSIGSTDVYELAGATEAPSPERPD